MSSKTVKGTVKGKGGSPRDSHSAAAIERRLAKLEGVVDELVVAAIPDQLEAIRQRLTNDIMEREVQDKVLHTYLKTTQVQATPAAPASANAAQSPPPCSVAEAAELSAQQEVVRTQLFAFSQVFQRDLSAMLRNLNDLKERLEAVEAPAKAARFSAEKAAESSVRAIEEKAAASTSGAPTASPQQSYFCTPTQVQALIANSITEARAKWRSELEHELANSGERKAELGRTLVKEFERSIVGHHAERLAATEEKMQSLRRDLEKLQSATDALSESAQANKDASKTADEVASTHSQQTQVEIDLGPLHTEMQRLVSVVQGLQMQSEQVMGMLEQSKIALQKEVQTRMQEDQRIEGFLKDQLAKLGEKSNGELSAMVQQLDNQTPGTPNPEEIRKNLQEIINRVGVDAKNQRSGANDDLNSAENVAHATDFIASASSAAKSQKGKGGEPTHLLDDLRSTILTYFRSEFQDYVGETLQKLDSTRQSTPSPQRGQQPPFPAISHDFSPGLTKRQFSTPSDALAQQSTPSTDLISSVKNVRVPPAPGRGGSFTVPTPVRGSNVLPMSTPDTITRSLMGKTLRPPAGFLQSNPSGQAFSPTSQMRSVSADVPADRLDALRRASSPQMTPRIDNVIQTAAFGIQQTTPGNIMQPAAGVPQASASDVTRSASPTRSDSTGVTAEQGSSIKMPPRADAHSRIRLGASNPLMPPGNISTEPSRTSTPSASNPLMQPGGNTPVEVSRNSTPSGKKLGSSLVQGAAKSSTVQPAMTHLEGVSTDPARPGALGAPHLPNASGAWSSSVQVAATRTRRSSSNTESSTVVRQVSYPFASAVQVQRPTVLRSPRVG